MSHPLHRLVAVAAALSLPLTAASVSAEAAPSPGAPLLTSAKVLSEQPSAAWRVEGIVYDLVVTRTRVYVGGRFSKVTHRSSGVQLNRSNLAVFNRQTGRLVRSWRPSTNGPVRALAYDAAHDQIIVGGAFTKVNGRDRANLVGLKASDGSRRILFRGRASGDVRDLLVFRDHVFVGGTFFMVNGNKQPRLAKLGTNRGYRDTDWRGIAEQGGVYSLTLGAKRKAVIVGGSFSGLSGATRRFLGSVYVDQGRATGWNPRPACDTCVVIDTDVQGDRVVVGTGGSGGGRVRAYDAGNGRLLWRVLTNGNVQAVDAYGTAVFVGGHFSQVRGQLRTMVAGLNIRNGGLRPFSPRFQGPYFPGLWSVKAGSDGLRVAGAFDGVSGRRVSGLARFPA